MYKTSDIGYYNGNFFNIALVTLTSFKTPFVAKTPKIKMFK